MAKLVLAYDRTPPSQVGYERDKKLLGEVFARFPLIVKIGYQALTAYGAPGTERQVASFGEQMRAFVYESGGIVIWDAKYKDIGNTVQQAVINMAGLVGGITVHTDRDTAWLARVVEARDRAAGSNPTRKPVLFGVTSLTDMDDTESDYLYSGRVRVVVEKRVHALLEAGFDGVVCSGHELDLVNLLDPGHRLTRLVPATRPAWASDNDQKRVMTPKEAIARGADLLVFGRPVWEHANPLAAVDLLLNEIT